MMARISRFEDLIAWQKARGLAREVYHASGDGVFSKDFGLSAQIRRAAVSVMSNIAEGFERNRPAEFHQSLSTAKAWCAEVRSQLYVALDAGYLNQEDFDRLMADAAELARILGGLRSSVERQREGKR